MKEPLLITSVELGAEQLLLLCSRCSDRGEDGLFRMNCSIRVWLCKGEIEIESIRANERIKEVWSSHFIENPQRILTKMRK